MNLAARRSAAGSSDSAQPGAAEADAAQPRAAEVLGQPQHAAKSTAKRKRSDQGAAPINAERGRTIADSPSNGGLPSQFINGDAELSGSEVGTASHGVAVPAGAEPRVAAKPAKLALVEDDLDWDGDNAQDGAHKC